MYTCMFFNFMCGQCAHTSCSILRQMHGLDMCDRGAFSLSVACLCRVKNELGADCPTCTRLAYNLSKHRSGSPRSTPHLSYFPLELGPCSGTGQCHDALILMGVCGCNQRGTTGRQNMQSSQLHLKVLQSTHFQN